MSITYTLTAPTPSTGWVNNASANFTVALPGGANPLGTVTITPADTQSATFTPTTVALTAAAPTATFTVTQSVVGLGTITTTNSTTGTVTIVNPAAGVGYTAGSMVYTLSPPTPASGGVDVNSGNFTAALPAGENPGGTVTLTLQATLGSGTVTYGTFTPATVALSNTVRSATFQFMPSVPNAYSISATNGSSFANTATITYTCVGKPTTAQTVFRNTGSVTITLSFLRRAPIAPGATFTYNGSLADTIRSVGGHTIRKNYDSLVNMLNNGFLEVVSSPDVVLRDTATNAVKVLKLTSGSLATTDPTWGAYTDPGT